MSLEALIAALPEANRRHLGPTAPAAAKMMAAKGLVPLPPRELVLVLCGLMLDADEKLSQAASTTVSKLPDKLLLPALQGTLPLEALMLVAPLVMERDEVVEPLVLNRAVPDDVIALVAGGASERVCEIISSNQERCMRSKAILLALRQNTRLLKSSLDRLFDFLARAGVVHDDIPELTEALNRLTSAELEHAMEKIELPPEVAHLLETATHAAAPEAATTEASSQHEAQEKSAAELAKAIESHGDNAAEQVPILKLIAGLNTAQKVALALKGNKEARTALIRDRNKMVATAAVRSPRLTEQEVVSAATSRSIADDVIRIIAASKEHTRSYAVKLALVGNPKTPLPTAMRLLTLLRQNDIRSVAKSKNVPSAIANQAKRLATAQSGGNKPE